VDVYDGLTRAKSTVLVQLRTGKIAFNDYLRSIRVRDSPLCDLCGHPNPLLQSPLQSTEESLQLSMDVDASQMEIRCPFIIPPWWTPPPITISSSKLAALVNHGVNEIGHPDARRIYTNGSEINGLVGCSAISLIPPITQKAFMGTATKSSVPLAELAGIALALRLANEDTTFHDPDLEIYTDNQGALRTLNNSGQSSGQRIIQRILDDTSIDIYDGLTRAESTVLVQLRTGKIAFNDYLTSIGVRDSPLCDLCGLRSQTIKHVLIDCMALDDLRHSIWNDSGIPSTVSRFLTDPKQVWKTAQLVLQAGLIPYLSGQPAAPTHNPSASNNQTPSGTSGGARS
jgi:hypothetical protein